MSWKVRGRFVEGSWKVRGRFVEGFGRFVIIVSGFVKRFK
jgi:hypothetical protein